MTNDPWTHAGRPLRFGPPEPKDRLNRRRTGSQQGLPVDYRTAAGAGLRQLGSARGRQAIPSIQRLGVGPYGSVTSIREGTANLADRRVD